MHGGHRSRTAVLLLLLHLLQQMVYFNDAELVVLVSSTCTMLLSLA